LEKIIIAGFLREVVGLMAERMMEVGATITWRGQKAFSHLSVLL